MTSSRGTRKPVAADPTLENDAGDRPEHLAFLDGLTVPQLNEVLQRAQQLKDAKLEGAKADFLARMKAESEQLGLDLGSLFTPTPPKRGLPPTKAAGKGSGVAAKYLGPCGEEWSGRGRAPKWL